MAAEKKYAPTAKKRRQSRKEGQHGKSRFLSSSVGLIAGITLILGQLDGLERPFWFPTEIMGENTDFGSKAMILCAVRAWECFWSFFGRIALGVFLAVAATELLQVGWYPSFIFVAPRLRNLNPILGLHRMMGMDSSSDGSKWPRGFLVECVLCLFVYVIAATVIGTTSYAFNFFLPFAEVEAEIFTAVEMLISMTALPVGLVFGILGSLNWALCRKRHEKN